ncbi:hypothetical protein BGX26_011250 [Mortierella sp. AD094]|nr:hypothetical protein BGX26_011250 [Mortierella sp. AD094]
MKKPIKKLSFTAIEPYFRSIQELDFVWESCVVDHSKDARSIISADALKSHAHFIHTLTHRGLISPEHLLIRYPNLRTLRIHDNAPSYAGADRVSYCGQPTAMMKMWLGVAALIRDTSTLTTVELSANRSVLANRVWNAIEVSSTVTTLRLSNVDIGHHQTVDFWSACATLKKLEMEHCFVWSSWRSTLPDSFPRMQEIKFRDVRLRTGNLIRVMANSPQLLSFFWRGGRKQDWFSVREIYKGLETTTGFLSLESLDLSSGDLNDGDISQVIRGMKNPIIKLAFPKTMAGSLSLTALEPHFRTIQQLDLRDCWRLKSKDTVMLLRSCPKLISFKAGMLHASHVEEDERWACADNLTGLYVYITVCEEPSQLEEESRRIFACLSKLTLLQEFDIARYGTTVDLSSGENTRQPLQFRLDRGFRQLSTLSRMRKLSFGAEAQAMTMDEGLWIKKHWRMLESIQGKFNVDSKLNGSLRKLFRENKLYRSRNFWVI